MNDFHNTPMGRLFYGKNVPELIKELRRIADSLEQGNKTHERELIREKKLKKSSTKKIIKEASPIVEHVDKISSSRQPKKNHNRDLDIGNE